MNVKLPWKIEISGGTSSTGKRLVQVLLFSTYLYSFGMLLNLTIPVWLSLVQGRTAILFPLTQVFGQAELIGDVVALTLLQVMLLVCTIFLWNSRNK